MLLYKITYTAVIAGTAPLKYFGILFKGTMWWNLLGYLPKSLPMRLHHSDLAPSDHHNGLDDYTSALLTLIHLFIHLHLADAFIQSDLQCI